MANIAEKQNNKKKTREMFIVSCVIVMGQGHKIEMIKASGYSNKTHIHCKEHQLHMRQNTQQHKRRR